MNSIISKSALFYDLKRKLRFKMSLHPDLFFPLVRFWGRQPHLAVNEETEIVIEGFPRSANSFSVNAFEQQQTRHVEIAHHMHAPAQIIEASRRNIPCVLLIRFPVDAVVSLRSLDLQIVSNKTKKHPLLDSSINLYLKQWIRFHNLLLPYSDGYVIALFDEVIESFDKIIEKVNLKFGASFEVNLSFRESLHLVPKNRGYHALPSNERQVFKRRAKAELEESTLKFEIEEAQSIYAKYVKLAQKQLN